MLMPDKDFIGGGTLDAALASDYWILVKHKFMKHYYFEVSPLSDGAQQPHAQRTSLRMLQFQLLDLPGILCHLTH